MLIACQESKAYWMLVFSFPNSVWERTPRNSVSRLPRGQRTADAKQSFAKIGSQTEFGNQQRKTRFPVESCYRRKSDPSERCSFAETCSCYSERVGRFPGWS